MVVSGTAIIASAATEFLRQTVIIGEGRLNVIAKMTERRWQVFNKSAGVALPFGSAM